VSRFGCAHVCTIFIYIGELSICYCNQSMDNQEFQKAIEEYQKFERMPLARHRLVRPIHLGHLSNSLKIIGMDGRWSKNFFFVGFQFTS
jgi:hypothetical protein